MAPGRYSPCRNCRVEWWVTRIQLGYCADCWRMVIKTMLVVATGELVRYFLL